MARSTSTPAKNDRTGAAQKLVAISYARVSTPGQATDDTSGIERQAASITRWLQQHPGYELDREVRHVGSGAKAGRFEWFIEELQQSRLPQGTCLVVEKISRFSREPVTDVFKTLMRLFDAGGAIAACELGGEPLTNFDAKDGSVFMLLGAIQRARGEWEERRDRKQGSDAMKRRMIAEGGKPFKARAKDKRCASYPFWLDFNEKSQQFEANGHATWVHDVFLWAQEVGAVTIAHRLAERGVRQVTNRRKPISSAHVTTILRDRAVLGERQHLTSKRRPSGDPVPGVYLPIVTAEEWRLAWDAIEQRNSRQGAIAHRHLHNLFEGRIFCEHCQGRIGYGTSRCTLASGERKIYYYLRCNTRVKDRAACQAPQQPYDEDRLLKRLQTFRWAEYFNDARHDADVAAARDRVLAAEGRVAEVQQKIQMLQQAMDDFIANGRAWPEELEDRRASLERDLLTAEADANVTRAALDALRRRRTGKDAAAAIQTRVAAFMASDRTNVESRQQFNRWLFAEGIVIAFDLIADRFELGTGKVSSKGLLVELDQVLEDAAAFGMDIDQVRVALGGSR
jgi:DNA invertase Pin-like site-specific DNA recombinase